MKLTIPVLIEYVIHLMTFTLNHADSTPSTRQGELDSTDHTDQE